MVVTVKTSTADLVSITEFSRSPSSYVSDLADNERKVILKNNKPVAVIVSAEEIDRIDAEREDALDLALALTRKMADSGERIHARDVFAGFGIDWDAIDSNEHGEG